MTVKAHNIFVNLVFQVHLLLNTQLAISQLGVEFVLQLDHMIDVLLNLLLSVDGWTCQLNHQFADLDLERIVDHLGDQVILGQRLHLLLLCDDHSRNCH